MSGGPTVNDIKFDNFSVTKSLQLTKQTTGKLHWGYTVPHQYFI